ncbi:MAG: hypothetical protein IKJ05_02965 [Oscillospiraceae bacterium]|nr:hypothetical protein [Oscillospiraceae bacterium]
MSDFNRQEIHQDFDEFFPAQADVGKRSISIPAAKMLAALASMAVTAALVFNTCVDCFATQIWADSALLDVNVRNLQEYQDVDWQLTEEDGGIVRQGKLDTRQNTLPLEDLKPGTQYIITFTTQYEGETKPLGDYRFTTGNPSGTGPSGTPVPPGPPAPVTTPVPTAGPTASPVPSLSPSPSVSPSPTATPAVTATPAPVPPAAQPTAAPTVAPTVEPSTEPSQAPMPEASADTAQLISVTSEPDMGSGILVEFPFRMNSDNDFINTPVKYIIDYEITDANNTTTPYSEEVVIEDPGTFSAAQMFASIPYGGGVSGSATLVYSTEDLRTGEITADRQVTSEAFALSEIRFAGGGTVNDLVIDTTARTISGNVTFNVDRGPYASTVAGSQLTGNDVWLTVYRPGQRTQVAQWMMADTATTSQGENMTVSFENFDISNQMSSFTLGTSYTFEFSADGQWGVNGMMGASSAGYASDDYRFGQAPTAGTPEVVAGRPTSPPDVQIMYPFNLNSYVPVAGDTITVEETGYYLDYDGTVSTETAFSNTRTYVYNPGAETNEIIIDTENNLLYVTDTAGYENNYPEEIVYTANATFTYNGGTETLTSTCELSPYLFQGNQEVSLLNKITIDYDNITSQGTVYTIPYTVTLTDIVKGTGQLDVAEESISIDIYGMPVEGYTVSTGADGVTITGTAVVDTSQLDRQTNILSMNVYAEGMWTQDGVQLAGSYAYAHTEIRLVTYLVTFNEAVINSTVDTHGLSVSKVEIWYDDMFRPVTDYPAGVGLAPGEYVEIMVYLEGNVTQPLVVTPADRVTGVDAADVTVESPFPVDRGSYSAQEDNLISYYTYFIMPDGNVSITPTINIEPGA